MVTIIRPESPGKGVWVSDRRLYLDASGNVVEGKGANRVSLLVAAGGTLPMETARKYGLVVNTSPNLLPIQPEEPEQGEPVTEANAEPEAQKPQKSRKKK